MKVASVVKLSFVLLIVSVQIQSGEGNFVSTGMVLMSIIGGFLLGQVALTSFMILLMAIVPPDEARSLQNISFKPVNTISEIHPHHHHHRVLRSISPEHLFQSVYQSQTSVPANNPPQHRRNGKFLSSLLRSDPMNCMPQVMCELSAASEPSDSTGTLNDYMYVMNEILKPDDDDESGKPHTRSNNNKFKANKKSSTKKKRPIKKNESDEDDSSASPEDLPSSEVKVQGRAELMEMEDDDALEEKALEDLVKEDPGDIAYALADMKRRDNLKLRINNGDFKHLMSEEDSSAEFGYLPGFDQISYDRNFNRLQKSLREGRSLRRSSSLRNSRAIQEGFVQRKKRELQQSNNFFDRVRVAAEVGDFTRSARQCRALFDSCTTPQIGINQAVNTIRKAIVGTPMSGRKKNGLSSDELKRLVSELKSQQSVVPGGTDVKVVLNFGGPQSHDQVFQSQPTTPFLATPESSTVPYRPPPPPPTQNPSNQVAKKLEALQSFLKKQVKKTQILNNIPPITTTVLKPFQVNNNRLQSRNKNGKKPVNKPSIIDINTSIISINETSIPDSNNTASNSSSGIFKLDLFPQFEGNYQKTQDAIPPRTAKIAEMTNTITKLSKIIDSKLKKLENSDESLSLESSEESSPELILPPVKKSTRNPPKSVKTTKSNTKINDIKIKKKPMAKVNATRTFPKMSPKKSKKQPRIATPYPNLQMYEDFTGPDSPPYPSFNSIVEKAHSFLFSNRQVAPLPKDPRRYVPSAQRHAYQQHSNSMESVPPMAPRGRRSQPTGRYSPFPQPVYQFPFKFWK